MRSKGVANMIPCLSLLYFPFSLLVYSFYLFQCSKIFSISKFRFFSVTGLGIDLDYHDIEWFALEMNRDHSVVFEITSKYCILESFVGYGSYSISSKVFLPTVVDIMVF